MRGLLEPDLLVSQVERGSPVCETGDFYVEAMILKN